MLVLRRSCLHAVPLQPLPFVPALTPHPPPSPPLRQTARVRLQTPSAAELPAGSPFLPPPAVSQVMLLARSEVKVSERCGLCGRCGWHGWRNRGGGGTGRDLSLRAPLIPVPGWDPGGPNIYNEMGPFYFSWTVFQQ